MAKNTDAAPAKAKPEKGEKAPKPEKGEKAPKPEKGEKAPKPEKGEKAEKPEKPQPPPRPPVDLRLKVLKKFHGKFLPKGVLRDRHKAIMARWNSGEDHGGVTVEELKALLDDWKGTREKPPRLPKA
jgi:hypothetical protein